MGAVNLKYIADAFDEISDENEMYLNILTGEIINIPDDAGMIEKEQYEKLCDLVEDSDEYRKLPGKYEMRDKLIMIEFARQYPDTKISESLLRELGSAHPYREFKSAILHFGIEKQFYEYQYDKYIEYAREWCENMDIDYSE